MVKVSTSELPPRQLAVDIEVESERLDRATDQAYRRIAGRVNVPGFRKGKAPRSMVERVVGRQSIVEDALEHLVPEVVNEAIEQEKVEAYGRPRVESIQMDPLRIRAVVPLAPVVELGDARKKLRIEPQRANVEGKEVDEVIERLRSSHAQWVPVDRAARQGDRVGIDVHAEVIEEPGRVLLDSKDAEYVIDPEGAQPVEGFAARVEGMKENAQKTFTARLPDDYRDRAVAGKEARFSVTLHWVKERELPELNDSFAQQVGQYESMAAVRTAIEEQLREREEARAREANEAAALDKLVELATIEVPPQTVDHQAEHMLETFSENLERQGLKLEQYLKFAGKEREALAAELREDAEKRVKRSLALDAFVTAEKIEIEPTEVEEEVRKVAAGTATPEETEMAALGNPTTLARVEGALRERKGLERLVELATGGAGGPGTGKGKRLPRGGAATDTEPTSKADKGSQKPRKAAAAQEKS